MENNGLKQPEKGGPPRFLTLLLLGIELFTIISVSLFLITTTPQFISIFKGLELPLPFITIAFFRYWYLLELFVRGKRRWVNFSLSIFTMLLCGLIFFGYIFAVLQPIFAIQNMSIK
jgi:hypothetical protein